MLVELVVNIVDEPLPSKEEALMATLTSVTLIHGLSGSGLVSIHIIVIKRRSATLEFISDRAWIAVELFSNGTVGQAFSVQHLDHNLVIKCQVFSLLVCFHNRI